MTSPWYLIVKRYFDGNGDGNNSAYLEDFTSTPNPPLLINHH
jgi:hypothetical protein